MGEPLIYEDLYGNRIILTNRPSKEQLQAKKDERNKLLNKLFTTKPIEHQSADLVPDSDKGKPLHKYFQPGFFVRVDNRTTSAELQRLFQEGVRTIFVRLGYATPSELNHIMSLIHNSIEAFQRDKEFKLPIGIAMELRGEVLRTGRMRNDKSVHITPGNLIVLTSDANYKFVSQPEIMYVWNLIKCLQLLQLEDVIFINCGKIILRVVKILGGNVTCCVKKGDTLRSYMDVQVPYFVANNFEQNPEVIEDLQFAIKHNAQFIILPAVSNVDYLQQFKTFLRTLSCYCDVFVSFNNSVVTKNCIVKDIITNSDGLWLDKSFKLKNCQFRVMSGVQNIIRIGHKLHIPIIGYIPMKSRTDFMRFKNNKILPYLDSVLIEKSARTQTYPLVARKLFCVQPAVDCPEFPAFSKMDNNVKIGKQKQSNPEAMAESIKYHTTIQHCNALIINSALSHDTAKLLSRKHIYCPIIVVVDNETVGKQLNVYRNIMPVVFDEKLDNTEANRLEYALDFGIWSKVFDEGDFIITLYDSLYYDCVASKYRAIYVPKRFVNLERYDRPK